MTDETRDQIKQNRIAQLEFQIADTQLNIAIYNAVVQKFGKEEDRRTREAEREKLERLETALAVVTGGDW